MKCSKTQEEIDALRFKVRTLQWQIKLLYQMKNVGCNNNQEK